LLGQSGSLDDIGEEYERLFKRLQSQVKVYKNPHTGEVVETKGGNHKTLKEWKAQHGTAIVESWLTK
jgi:hypothetical protein